ncbi:MAG: hypothetical protein ACXWL5_00435 [Candidatus Chromulinivorax sp.]
MKNNKFLILLFVYTFFIQKLFASEDYLTIFNGTGKSLRIQITWIKHNHHGNHKKHTTRTVPEQTTIIEFPPEENYTYEILKVFTDEPNGSNRSYIGKKSLSNQNRYFILQPEVLGFNNQTEYEQIVAAFEN